MHFVLQSLYKRGKLFRLVKKTIDIAELAFII